MPQRGKKQNLTVSLSPEIIRKAKVLAARRSMSISGLVAEQIMVAVGAADEYERSKRAAFAMLEKGFRLGGRITSTRDDFHER